MKHKSFTPLLLALLLLTAGLVLAPGIAHAQEQQTFTRADTLRGSITPQRAWWEVVHYDLNVNVQPYDTLITGFNRITYRVADTVRAMQIDLQEPLQVDRITQDGEPLAYNRQGSAFFVQMPQDLQVGDLHTVTVYYQGAPRIAPNPPWEGGFIWARDEQARPWIATANQGLGASAWWPTKDHQSAEPDSMRISITVPQPLINVSNGRLTGKQQNEDYTTTWTWKVENPINNYNVAVNAGNYVNFTDTWAGARDTLDLSYWVLDYNLEKAKSQFQEVKPMMSCFEEWFGPYPFYEDGFKMVETPHLGMEHQSAIAYGNDYQMGYNGTDLSGTGLGMKFDFIIIHEAAHEWWGNSVTSRDIADMWIHESFANYAENLYVGCRWGENAGADYVVGTRSRILNNEPIIGTYGVNDKGSSDMYYKGGNMLHMIRQLVDDDSLWKSTLRGLQEEFRHRTVTTGQVESYIDERTAVDLEPIFDQYLRHTDIPTLQYYLDGGRLYYRWKADVEGFNMPVRMRFCQAGFCRVQPTTGEWRSIPTDLEEPGQFEMDRNWYVRLQHAPPDAELGPEEVAAAAEAGEATMVCSCEEED
ncbi:MAG: M1 family metallopeptidase [Balneolaceae bacterium]|nr:M1 family metallopeptidase [Balneolaceae bacterium]